MSINKDSQKAPNLRFKGFTDDWEQRKLGKIVEFYSGLTYSPDNIIPKGGTFVLRSSNVKNGELINADNVYVDSSFVNSSNVQIGDIVVVVRNGSRNLIGKHAQVKNYMENTVIGAFMTGIRAKEPNYINALLNTQQFKIEINKNLGATINQITTGAFKKMQFSITPNIEEQHEIGSFFDKLDNTITLHQRKLDQLNQLKEALLQQMFPGKGETVPKLRFAGFEGDWEERKLGDLLNKNTEKNKDLSVINVESVSNKTGFTKQTEQFEDYSVASADLSNYYVIRECQFAYNPSRINVGSIAYKALGDDMAVVSPLYVSFSTKKGLHDGFIWNWFKTPLFDAQRQRLSEGGVRDTLSFNQLSEMNIISPEYLEQEKISDVFKQLDNTTTLQQRKLEQLQNMKQVLLQNMFI